MKEREAQDGTPDAKGVKSNGGERTGDEIFFYVSLMQRDLFWRTRLTRQSCRGQSGRNLQPVAKMWIGFFGFLFPA